MSALIFRTAISVLGSRPMILAVYLLSSCRMTSTLLALPTTWLLVTTIPGRIDDKARAERDALGAALWPWGVAERRGRSPLPRYAARRSAAANHRTASRGNLGHAVRRPSLGRGFCVTEILTTAGDTFLTSGAKLSAAARSEVIVCGPSAAWIAPVRRWAFGPDQGDSAKRRAKAEAERGGARLLPARRAGLHVSVRSFPPVERRCSRRPSRSQRAERIAREWQAKVTGPFQAH